LSSQERIKQRNFGIFTAANRSKLFTKTTATSSHFRCYIPPKFMTSRAYQKPLLLSLMFTLGWSRNGKDTFGKEWFSDDPLQQT